MILIGFLSFLFFTTGLIGFWASRKNKKSEVDYFLASQSVSPYILGLSSSASKFSGVIFAGFMGFAYTNGTVIIWLLIASGIGHCVAFSLASYRLQQINVKGWALSVNELISFWRGDDRVWLRRFLGFISLFFLSIMAALQLKAGGKALEGILEWPFYIGVLLSSIIILFYCWSGGIRASIWTDASQMIVMIFSLLLILVMAVVQEGGIINLVKNFMATTSDSNQVALFPQNLSIGGPGGLLLFTLGAIGMGACNVGQPQMLIRSMVLRSSIEVKKFIITNCLVDTGFRVLCVFVGLSTRVILRDVPISDAEHVLFLSAKATLPAIAVGIVLAGTFSAALSSADSQIISCTSSLMRDFSYMPKQSLILAKLGTLGVTLVATLIALFSKSSIFLLSVFAFSGLGASIGSILILRLFNCNISQWATILVGLVGGSTVIIWKLTGLTRYIYEAIPGFLAAFSCYFILKFIHFLSKRKC